MSFFLEDIHNILINTDCFHREIVFQSNWIEITYATHHGNLRSKKKSYEFLLV